MAASFTLLTLLHQQVLPTLIGLIIGSLFTRFLLILRKKKNLYRDVSQLKVEMSRIQKWIPLMCSVNLTVLESLEVQLRALSNEDLNGNLESALSAVCRDRQALKETLSDSCFEMPDKTREKEEEK